MQDPVYIATAKDQGMPTIPKTPSPRLRQYKKTDTAPNKQNLITSGSTPLQADYDATSAARPLQTHVTYWTSTRTMMVAVIPARLTTRRQQTLLHNTDALHILDSYTYNDGIGASCEPHHETATDTFALHRPRTHDHLSHAATIAEALRGHSRRKKSLKATTIRMRVPDRPGAFRP